MLLFSFACKKLLGDQPLHTYSTVYNILQVLKSHMGVDFLNEDYLVSNCINYEWSVF